MSNIPLADFLTLFLNIMSAPIIFVDALFAGMQLEWISIGNAFKSGDGVTLSMVLPLLKNLALLIFLILLAIFLLTDTLMRFLFAGIGTKRFSKIISDVLLVMMTLFFYYMLIAMAIYGFFNIILPLNQAPKPGP